jgi:hypothetical protein
MPLERGILVSYEKVRRWVLKLGPTYAAASGAGRRAGATSGVSRHYHGNLDGSEQGMVQIALKQQPWLLPVLRCLIPGEAERSAGMRLR